jgi:hypothetical protein
MHVCGCCRKACSCGGDTSNVVALTEPPGCLCCIGCCDHGIEIGSFCWQCELQGYEVEPDAEERQEEIPAPAAAAPQLNGGW